MVSEDQVRDRLEQVVDPELGVNIVDLGLVYEIDIDEGGVHVLMTLTSPGCPLHDIFREEVKENVSELEGVEEEDIEVELTFDPPWSREEMSDEARAEIGFI